ncbi:MAG: hypothetical protein JSS72_09560 [Armatimonadetes bacterium]|nr:hypothetical protein [Armatimonadota bacterium]
MILRKLLGPMFHDPPADEPLRQVAAAHKWRTVPFQLAGLCCLSVIAGAFYLQYRTHSETWLAIVPLAVIPHICLSYFAAYDFILDLYPDCLMITGLHFARSIQLSRIRKAGYLYLQIGPWRLRPFYFIRTERLIPLLVVPGMAELMEALLVLSRAERVQDEGDPFRDEIKLRDVIVRPAKQAS